MVYPPLLTVAFFKSSNLPLFPTTAAVARGNTRTLAGLSYTSYTTRIVRASCPLAPWWPERVCVIENNDSSRQENGSNRMQRTFIFGSHNKTCMFFFSGLLGLFVIYTEKLALFFKWYSTTWASNASYYFQSNTGGTKMVYSLKVTWW